MSSSISILNKLKDINNTTLIPAVIPSLGKEMMFKHLSVKQQKDMMKTGLDGAISGLTISNAITNLILENSKEPYDYLITDRLPIILTLRTFSFGAKVSVKEPNDIQNEFDLTKILSKKLKFTSKLTHKIGGSSDELKMELAVPSLKDDKMVNDYQLSLIKKSKEEQSISDTVGSMFLFEICKFISSITIGDEQINMKETSIKDRALIVENIPASVNGDVLEYIQTFRKEETEYLTIDGNVLPIDARLFSKD